MLFSIAFYKSSNLIRLNLKFGVFYKHIRRNCRLRDQTFDCIVSAAMEFRVSFGSLIFAEFLVRLIFEPTILDTFSPQKLLFDLFLNRLVLGYIRYSIFIGSRDMNFLMLSYSKLQFREKRMQS